MFDAQYVIIPAFSRKSHWELIVLIRPKHLFEKANRDEYNTMLLHFDSLPYDEKKNA